MHGYKWPLLITFAICDIVIIVETLQDVEEMLNSLDDSCSRVYLGMNFDKIKVMINTHVSLIPVATNSATLKVV